MTVSIQQPELHEILPRPHRFSAEDYLQLSEQGYFDGKKTEFIDGEIIDVASQLNDHAYCLTRTLKTFRSVFDEEKNWHRPQMTLKALDNLPEPDLVVLRYPPEAGRRIPKAEDALIVVEVSDTTLLFDTTVKASLYAAAGIPEYWVLSISDRLLIVHRDPTPSATSKFGSKYGTVRNILPGVTVAPLAAETCFVDPIHLLPPA